MKDEEDINLRNSCASNLGRQIHLNHAPGFRGIACHQQFNNGPRNNIAHTARTRIVMTIARVLDRSCTMPIIPKIRDNGKHPNISNAPSDAIGLPHPGRRTVSSRNVANAIPNNIAEIFPNRISKKYLSNPIKSRFTSNNGYCPDVESGLSCPYNPAAVVRFFAWYRRGI